VTNLRAVPHVSPVEPAEVSWQHETPARGRGRLAVVPRRRGASRLASAVQAITTPPAPWTRSRPGCASRSTWTRSAPSCWPWSTRRCSRPRCRCGCGRNRLKERLRPSWPGNAPEDPTSANHRPRYRPCGPAALALPTTLRDDQGRLRQPPQAARTESPPRTRTRRMDQSREAHFAARPHHSPEAADEPPGRWFQPLLQVVADYTRLNAVLAAGRAGRGRASGPQYPGVGLRPLRRYAPCGSSGTMIHRTR
jgi:hypothetical protein